MTSRPRIRSLSKGESLRLIETAARAKEGVQFRAAGLTFSGRFIGLPWSPRAIILSSTTSINGSARAVRMDADLGALCSPAAYFTGELMPQASFDTIRAGAGFGGRPS